MPEGPKAYRVHGMWQSYFTRKMTGYLDYKGIPWAMRRFSGFSPEATAAGWPGGVPLVKTPDDRFMWDTTAMIHHLERCHPEPSVLPPDPVQRFLCYLVEDVADEWMYRPAVGSRWFYDENSSVGGFELARDVSVTAPMSCDAAKAVVGAHVRSSCGPLGVDEHSIAFWIEQVVKPWIRVLDGHFARWPFLFGDRPSLADFAIFGGNAAHFVNDPLCRRWMDAEGPHVVRHTHCLLEPEEQGFAEWSDAGEVPDTLVAILADAGRLYLPWVSRATVEGAAPLEFAGGPTVDIHATDFLREARSILLAHYVALRSDALDRVLERAGVLGFFADFARRAGAVPRYDDPPRPALNRPFPPAEEFARGS
jgi:glutathione S-transferase